MRWRAAFSIDHDDRGIGRHVGQEGLSVLQIDIVPDVVVFEERWDKGEHFRSGLVWTVGQG
jgi:hypothetical protein